MGYGITNSRAKIDADGVLNYAFPIGTIYTSEVNISPETFLGGAWQSLEQFFLLGSGNVYSCGDTGGEYEVTLAVENLPSHVHKYNVIGAQYAYAGDNDPIPYFPYNSQTGYAGGDQPHDNMPPYLSVYMWERIE